MGKKYKYFIFVHVHQKCTHTCTGYTVHTGGVQYDTEWTCTCMHVPVHVNIQDAMSAISPLTWFTQVQVWKYLYTPTIDIWWKQLDVLWNSLYLVYEHSLKDEQTIVLH